MTEQQASEQERNYCSLYRTGELVVLLLLLSSPAISMGFTILDEIFAYVTVFNAINKVVTFRLRGWCMLGVILLPAFTRQGHECQDLFSPCDRMHVSTD